MKKKGLLLLSAFVLALGLAACESITTTVPTTQPTTSGLTTSGTTAGTTATTTVTTATTTQTTTQTTTTATTTTVPTTTFSIALSGLDDAGFTEDDRIYANEYFDLLAGVHAYGSDGVDYADRILLQSDDAACQIGEDGMLMSTSAKVCTVTYTVVVNSKMARSNRLIKIMAAPITIEFTETDKIDNDVWLGTDAVAVTSTTWDGSTPYIWHYWQASSTVLGTTGIIEVSGGKLIIDQETLGGVNYGLQTMMLTDVELEKGRTYKITFTLTSDADRYIDIVTKAPNNNYAEDTHSIIEVLTGTFEYEMVFVANQTVLHMNIMTGVVETSVNAGRLEFSDFVLWEGPIVIDYVELPDFFTNSDVTVGTMIEYITTTDADYVREFYYWDQSSGNLMTGEIIEDGIEVVVVTAAANDYGIQLQWNDMNKAGTALKKDAYYKFTFNINSSVERTMVVSVTGSSNSLASSGSQSYSLIAGDNEIVLEFVSLYDYFFTKIQFGNYGDLVQTGTFTLTNFKLWEQEGAVEPEEPIDEGAIIGNVFGTIANVNAAALGVESLDLGTNWETSVVVEIPKNTFYLWHGIAATGWFSWAEYPIVAATYTGGQVVVDLEACGSEFWSTQLKYQGGALVIGVDYLLSFKVYAEVARRINVQVKDGTFNAAYSDFNVDLVAGYNLVEVPFTAGANTFNLQINLGTFAGETIEEGTFAFDSFTVSRPVQEVAGYFDNGDFAIDQTFAGADADGWAYWSTQGIPDAWALPNYIGTTTIAGGVMTSVTTQTGGEVWAQQIQYNHVGATLTVGAVYKVEFDVNSDTATTICVELKYDDNSLNKDITVPLVVGDNHVTIYYVATQARFKLFVMLGLTAPSTLVFDNFKLSEPIVPEPVEPIDEIDYWPVENGIQNGDFNAEGFGVNVEGSGWTSWTTVGESSWTKAIDATFVVTDGAVVVTIIDDATNHGVGDHLWSIQFCYRPTDELLNVEAGKHYKIEFDVNASVAGTFSMEMSTTDNVANVAIPVTLVVGANHVVVEYVAYEANFKLTACLGQYGPATLTFDNFLMSEEVVLGFDEIADGIQNGDFSAEGFGVNVEGSGWTSWTTVGESSWTKAIDATFVVTDGAVVVTIIDDATNHGVGDHLWSIQFCYRPIDALLNVIPGHTYRVEFDVNATVAGTFSMEMSTTDNVANVAIPVTLVVGANHVVVEYVAYEANFKLTACIGQYGPAVLTFDNFVISELGPRV